MGPGTGNKDDFEVSLGNAANCESGNDQSLGNRNDLKKGGTNEYSLNNVNPEGLSTVALTFNFVKSLIGAGIFAIPSVLSGSGFFFSIIAIVLCGFLIYYTGTLLTIVADEINTVEYNAVFRHAVGKWGAQVPGIIIIVFVTIALVGYCVIIADSLPTVILHLSGYNDPEYFENVVIKENPAWKILDRRIFILFVTFFAYLPICLMRSLKFLAKTSLFGLFVVVFILVSVTVRSATTYPDDPVYDPYRRKEKYVSELLTFVVGAGFTKAVSAAAYSNIVQHSQLSLLRSLRDQSYRNKCRVLAITLTISIVATLGYAIPVYLNIGSNVKSNVLNSFPSDDMLISICRIFYSANIVLTFPLHHYVTREVIIFFIHKKPQEQIRYPFFAVYSFIIVAAIVGISMTICNLGTIVDIAGGITGSLLVFVLPQVSYVAHRYKQRAISLKRALLILSTTLVGLITIAFTLYDALKPSDGSGATKCQHIYLGK